MAQGVAVNLQAVALAILSIRSACDAALATLEGVEGVDMPTCAHEKKSPKPGSVMGDLKYICEDCGKELEQ